MGLNPEFTQMGTNMITSYIMNTYSTNMQQLNLQVNIILPFISEKPFQDPDTWKNMITVDEIRQSNSDSQRPLSDSYLSGAPSKKRKVDNNP